MADLNKDEVPVPSLLDEVIEKTARKFEQIRAQDIFPEQSVSERPDSIPPLAIEHGPNRHGDVPPASVLHFEEHAVVLRNDSGKDIALSIQVDQEEAAWIKKLAAESSNSIAPNTSGRESTLKSIVIAARLHAAFYRDNPSPKEAAEQLGALILRHFEKPGSGKPNAVIAVESHASTQKERFDNMTSMAQTVVELEAQIREQGKSEEEILALAKRRARGIEFPDTGALLEAVLDKASNANPVMPVSEEKMPAILTIRGEDPNHQSEDGSPYVHFTIAVGIERRGGKLHVDFIGRNAPGQKDADSLKKVTERIIQFANSNDMGIEYWRISNENLSDTSFK